MYLASAVKFSLSIASVALSGEGIWAIDLRAFGRRWTGGIVACSSEAILQDSSELKKKKKRGW
jgi:hypothetical protein